MLQSAQLLICFPHCDFLLFLLLASQKAPRLWKPTREIHTEKNAFSIVFTGLELMNLSTDRISVTCQLSEAASRKHQGDPWYPTCNFSGFGGSEWDLLRGVTSFFDMPWGQLRLCTGCLTYGGFLITKFWKTMKNFAEKHCANMYLAYYDCRYRNTCQYVAIREVELCASIPGSWNETGTARMTCLG